MDKVGAVSSVFSESSICICPHGDVRVAFSKVSTLKPFSKSFQNCAFTGPKNAVIAWLIGQNATNLLRFVSEVSGVSRSYCAAVTVAHWSGDNISRTLSQVAAASQTDPALFWPRPGDTSVNLFKSPEVIVHS